jgi:hypothetical protein
MLSTFLFSYYGKVEPLDTYTLKSNVNGKVISINSNLEGKTVNNKIVVNVDTFNDKIDLNSLKTQKKSISNQIEFYKNILNEQNSILKIKQDNYEVYKQLKTKSKTEKDLKLLDFISAKISINQTKITLSNLQNQLSSINSNIKKLEKTILDKEIKVDGYLYKLLIDKDDYISYGSPVATVMDISKTKISIFIPINEIEKIKNKAVYINDKKSNFTISKIFKVADEKYVTSYKIEIIGNYDKISDVVKVEFK